MARLFFAVSISPEAAKAVRRLQERLRAAMQGATLTWADPAQAHCTLKFLGEVEEAQLDDLRVAGQTASRLVGPFELGLAGVGGFPNVERPSVLWVGVRGGASELEVLASGLERELEPRGFAREQRPFSAHVTLARVKVRSAAVAASRVVRAWEEETLAGGRVEAFSLMRSTSTPQGVRYSEVHAFRLDGRG